MIELKDYARQLGTNGGNKTKKLYGSEHYQKIQLASAKARVKNNKAKGKHHAPQPSTGLKSPSRGLKQVNGQQSEVVNP